ncbi:hypothetical protein SAMN00768000_3713 [Sulfobacillus thermosulfidooxidans DSM 9293]|uniref:Uncharacterized protein n=1 Tax=Sulfobacillus thermosulfidooxidans (strain DSM 9293 / VKM B-1269 / AT-1) TaxID=929705 RepID=A0A1W1WPD0_SULTA|nr:IPT/TIG domain-containing protein [Sulfobacillus thermosulfidooxidans]SMC08174.1 hypothetical protein SAMN00768000_3713 [Sulfobacillus thermosulfidooxidans DSM 9293]
MVLRRPLPRLPAAAGTIGSVLGLILIFMGVTGGIAASRLWHVQQTLDAAAHAAAVSEAQNGCWTAQTSQIVSHILQGGGLPISGAHAVQVTQYSDPQGDTTPYGQVVTAKLQWAVPISVVRLQLPTSVTLSSNVDQPSQYVAFGSQNNTTNSTCTTPDLAHPGSSSVIPSVNMLAINSVQIVPTGQYSALITITGSGFGNHMPSLYTAPWGGQDTNHVELSYGQWHFGYYNHRNNPNAAGLQYLSWSPTTIVVEYPGNWSVIGPDPLNGGTLNVMVTVGGQTATFSQPVPSNGSSSSTTAKPVVTHIVADPNTNTVTVIGMHLPLLTNGTLAPYGVDYTNFLWADHGMADGNPNYPYSPDWGITVLSSTTNQLIFQPANGLTPGETWMLYLLPNGEHITSSTTPVASALIP